MTAPPRRRTRRVVREAVRATALAAFFLAPFAIAEGVLIGNPVAIAALGGVMAAGAFALTATIREARR